MSHSLNYIVLYSSPGQNTGVGSFFPSPGDLINPGIKLRSPALQADSLPAEPQGKPSAIVTGEGKVTVKTQCQMCCF